MASIRGIWVIELAKNSEDGSTTGKLVFSRRFRNVERRAAKLAGEGIHRPLPVSDKEWINEIVGDWSWVTSGTSIVPCSRTDNTPILEVPSQVWPVVVFQQGIHLFACVPLVDASKADLSVKPVAGQKLPSVTTGLCMLKELWLLVSAVKELGAEACQLELQHYINAACPLGTIAVVDAGVTMALSAARSTDTLTDKQPAWRPAIPTSKSRNLVTVVACVINVKELVRAVQYDSEDTPDVCEIYGSVQCKADVEGIAELTAGIQSDNGIESLTTHACVQALEPSGQTAAVSHMHRLRFTPPTSQFELCGYKMCASQIRLPIRGFFQMKAISRTAVKLLIQFKLDEELPNVFEYCEARLPFYNRGPVSSLEATQNSGVVAVAPNRRELTWNLGQRWKSREVAAPVTVQFSPTTEVEDVTLQRLPQDEFYIGDNACVLLKFKVPDATMSSTKCNPNNFTSSLGNKVKIQTGGNLTSASYKIWNSLGKSRRCLPADQLIDE